ncbi:non-ribosomal peptide synthetase [Aspergillus vadensis CBS 113365]|uniref:Nonribosomal peptide synthetase TdiA n=1 Tax=Aspergillus vadensis (strain CBS 113365 / IMI 142717 / IBT 24658) TaxID=1448311 RepID=A0A319BY72_ASPVC|nr:nonribosomal peptide synthetase TdiA [Aspergillus vadensis CBS 113365]PYH68088.1 nonribosomal peptide synthetase TdiA [Aspergillus vadensis CBS 113365]
MLLHPVPSPDALGLDKDPGRSYILEVVPETLPLHEATSLLELQQQAVIISAGITFYKISSLYSEAAKQVSYRQLLDQARYDVYWLQTSVPGLQRDTVFLLYFDIYEENICWFWACTLTGYLPCIVPKLAVSTGRRMVQAKYILQLLDDFVVLTNSRMECAFQGVDTPCLNFLMFTSGSTGFSKAVAFDYAVNLVEMYLQAMLLEAEQIQIVTDWMVAEPCCFLDLVNRHRISLIFVSNFFLALLRDLVCHPTPEQKAQPILTWDLSCLCCVFSGGEATVRQMAVQLLCALEPYGVQPFICSGYGLTESCAGMAWDLVDHTVDDLLHNTAGEFMSCGRPIPGVEMRVLRETDQSEAAAGEEGMLQLRGAVIFNQYYCDAVATRAVLTSDGWFIAGDNAYLDAHGRLYITSCSKDTLLLNGVTIFAVEVENSLEQTRILGLILSFMLSYCVVYLPSYLPDDAAARVATTEAIERIASFVVHVTPTAILPLLYSYFERTSSGALDSERKAHETSIQVYCQVHCQAPSSPTEEIILILICARLNTDPDSVSVTTNLFSLGLSLLDFYSVTLDLQQMFGMAFTVPDLLMDLTIAGLTHRLASKQPTAFSPKPEDNTRNEYDPVVLLQLSGPKTPLWLVHPVFAFHNCFIYAFRSRGVQPGEPLFATIAEMADIYAAAMKRTQPSGLYALAGYFLGSSIVFEIAKRLESAGEEVGFLGVLDRPPDIADLVGRLTWNKRLVMVGYFYKLIDEPRCVALMPELKDVDAEHVLDVILGEVNPERLKVLRLDRAGLRHVMDIINGFSRAAKGYTPGGRVEMMVDVFIVDFLMTVTDDRGCWVERYLKQWERLSRRGMVVHQCEGRHADMLGAKYVNGLQLVLRRVMEERGV